MYTLVVIDMQPYFSTSQKGSILAACKKEIRLAMQNKAAIVFVEYANYGLTDDRLTNLTKNYNRKVTVIKQNNGGGVGVKRAIVKNKFPKRNIRVSGVNINYCVYDTVSQLVGALKSAKIKVLSKACNCNGSVKLGFDRLSKINRVAVVEK